ncbi:MAG TPA: hypothetical protein VFU81_17095 [Thermomicrobiales bacterium]|nr:hypothetical protein [Thermomicrobiales bacterium]
MNRAGFGLAACLLAIVVAALMVGGPDRLGLAADATPGAATPRAGQFVPLADRPAQLVAGRCAKPGETVADLTALAAPQGDATGGDAAVIAEGSFTEVQDSLAALTSSPHAIVVGYGSGQPGRMLACGEIGGIADADGALVIGLVGLQPGAHGIAYLFPAKNGATTGISTFLASGFTAADARRGVGATPVAAVPTETPPGAAIDVSLREWEIDMPAKAKAGVVTFTITNDGTKPHSFDLSGNGVEIYLDAPLAPGQTGSLSANLPAGTYTVISPYGDGADVQKGMTTDLTVEAAP